MVALRGPAANHITTFWTDVSSDKKSAILGLFKSKLSSLYIHEEVRQWLADHPQLISEEAIKVANFFDQYDTVNHRLLLDCLRVCELQVSLDTYNIHVDFYGKSDMSDWVNLSLEANPKQTRVSIK